MRASPPARHCGWVKAVPHRQAEVAQELELHHHLAADLVVQAEGEEVASAAVAGDLVPGPILPASPPPGGGARVRASEGAPGARPR
jgi:hypothetical protein